MSSNQTLILSGEDVEFIVRHLGLNRIMDELIERLTQAIKKFSSEHTSIPARSGFNYQQPKQGLVEWMPLYQHGEQVMIKVVGYHPNNPESFQLPTIISTISAYDTQTGHLLGLVDGVLLTALRTGAASAVASKFMAAPNSKVLGLIGCGAQAVTQLHAISRIFDIEQVMIYDVDEQAMNSLAQRCEALELAVEFIPTSITDIVSLADILCTATSIDVGAGPLFKHQATKPALHINAVGSDFPGKVELPLDLLHQAFVCPDFTEQAMNEGECQRLAPETIGPDWIELIQNNKQYEYVRNQLTVFDSTGYPLEDKTVMDLFLDYAEELGLGQKVQIENISEDAKNPYQFLGETAFVEANKA